MSQSEKGLQSNGRHRLMAMRAAGVAGPEAAPPRGSARLPQRMAPSVRRGPEPSSEELFGRQPFTSGREPRYYGTGVPFYQSGPGFTGGYYGYGDETPEIPTELEREYDYDLYGDRAAWQASPPVARPLQAIQAMSGSPLTARSVPKKARKYPPGPKGYQRSDERILEEICDELMQTDQIDCSEVTVQVTCAKVTLDGTVPERWMKHAIEDLAAACPGVQDVDDRIRIKTAAQTT